MTGATHQNGDSSASLDDAHATQVALDGVDLVRGVLGLLDRSALFPEDETGAIRVEWAPNPDFPASVEWIEPTAFPLLDDDRSLELAISYCASRHGAVAPLRVWIHGTEAGIRLFYGFEPTPERGHVTRDHAPDLRQSLQAAFPGLTFSDELGGGATSRPRIEDVLNDRREVVSIVGLPSERERTEVRTSLDEALLALAGHPFDVFLEARPAPHERVDALRSILERVVNEAHELGSRTERNSFGQSFEDELRAGTARAITNALSIRHERGIGRSVDDKESTRTETRSITESSSLTHDLVSMVATAASAAVLLKTGSPQLAGMAHAGGREVKRLIGATKTEGIEATERGRVTSRTAHESMGTIQEEKDEARDERQQTRSESAIVERSVTSEIQKFLRQSKTIEDRANALLQRLEHCRGMGGWDLTVHVSAVTEGRAKQVANLLVGALRGDSSHIEPLRVVSYASPGHADSMEPTVGKILGEGRRLRRRERVPAPVPEMAEVQTLLSSDELALWFRPPNRTLPGLEVRPVARFASAGVSDRRVDANHIDLGSLVMDGRALDGARVSLSHEELCSHAFVVGTTGSGKTSTVRHILRSLQCLTNSSDDAFFTGTALSPREPIPFMVLEPAKREYRDLFEELVAAGRKPIRLVLGQPREEHHERRLEMNPLAAPVGLPVGRHAEGMKVLLRSCFELQESLPQVLERLLFDVYARSGWRDLTAVVTSAERRRMPTLASMLLSDPPAGGIGRGERRVDRVVAGLGYEDRVRANLAAAITVRLETFTRGLKGSIFGRDRMNFEDLLRRPVFIELSDVTEPDIRRFLLGALMFRLYGEREAERVRELDRGLRPSGQLRHLIVLEEAHHFLRSAAGAGPSAELVRQSNQLMADAFAELRSMGQGILVADQAPADLDPSVLRNTGTKLIHRLLHADDCRAVGDAMGLSDEQQTELRRLDPGQCVVLSPRLRHPVCCRVLAAER